MEFSISTQHTTGPVLIYYLKYSTFMEGGLIVKIFDRIIGNSTEY